MTICSIECPLTWFRPARLFSFWNVPWVVVHWRTAMRHEFRLPLVTSPRSRWALDQYKKNHGELAHWRRRYGSKHVSALRTVRALVLVISRSIFFMAIFAPDVCSMRLSSHVFWTETSDSAAQVWAFDKILQNQFQIVKARISSGILRSMWRK